MLRVGEFAYNLESAEISDHVGMDYELNATGLGLIITIKGFMDVIGRSTSTLKWFVQKAVSTFGYVQVSGKLSAWLLDLINMFLKFSIYLYTTQLFSTKSPEDVL